MRLFVTPLLVAFVVLICVGAIPVVTAQSYEYNDTFSREMLHAAGAAYCPGKSVQDWSCSFCSEIPGFTPYGVVYNSSTDMLSYVGYLNHTDTILVAFRGTSLLSILDWLEDLNFFQVPALCPACEIHEGFLKAYWSIREETVQLVREITSIYPESNIVITGHSLGGALTYIAAMDFALAEGINTTTTYTFGAPRVGNSAFRDQYTTMFQNTTNFRVTHGLDPVPHVPPRAFDFYHPRTEVYYDGLNTNYKVCDGSGEDPTCADQWLLPLGVTDHVTYLGIDFVAEWLKCNV